MLLFLRTFSTLILIVIFTISGAYILNTHSMNRRQAGNQIVNPNAYTRNVVQQETTLGKPLSLIIQQSKVQRAKTRMATMTTTFSPLKEKRVVPPAKPVKHLKSKKDNPPSVVTDKTPKPAPSENVTTPSLVMVNPNKDTQPQQDPPIQTVYDDTKSQQPAATEPISSVINPTTIVVDTEPVIDPNQQILDQQRQWMTTNLGATNEQLPTSYVPPVKGFVGNTGPVANFDGSEVISYDATKTGNDYSIRYIVADGKLYTVMEGKVPKELIPPGL